MMAEAVSLRLVALTVAVVLATVALPATATHEGKQRQYKVGGPDGWRVPPPELKEMYYANWASGITFYVGDSIEFVYKNDSVIQVDKASYYHCTETPPTDAAAPGDGRKLFRFDATGYAYFASTDLERCKMGERLMINVLPEDQLAASGPWPAPGPSSTAAGHSIAGAASSVHAVALVAPPVALALAGLL